jgi:hypothetical protein
MPQPTAASHQCIARQGSTHVDTWYATSSSKTMCDNCYSFVADSNRGSYLYFLLELLVIHISVDDLENCHMRSNKQYNLEGRRMAAAKQWNEADCGRIPNTPYSMRVKKGYIQRAKQNLLCTCREGDVFTRSKSSGGHSRPSETGSIPSATSARRLLGQRYTCRSWKCKRSMWLLQNF